MLLNGVTVMKERLVISPVNTDESNLGEASTCGRQRWLQDEQVFLTY